MDHLHRVRDRHIASFAPERLYGVHPSAEGHGAGRLARWVVLPRSAPEACRAERIAATNGARATSPKQIARRTVLFVAIDVTDLNIPSRAA